MVSAVALAEPLKVESIPLIACGHTPGDSACPNLIQDVPAALLRLGSESCKTKTHFVPVDSPRVCGGRCHVRFDQCLFHNIGSVPLEVGGAYWLAPHASVSERTTLPGVCWQRRAATAPGHVPRFASANQNGVELRSPLHPDSAPHGQPRCFTSSPRPTAPRAG